MSKTTALLMLLMLLMLLVAACSYEASFADCTVTCTPDLSCPDNLACGNEGLCRVPGVSGTCVALRPSPPSCEGLPTTCGPSGDQDCCSSAVVPGGTFLRGFDGATDGMYADTSHPATVSPFVLDRFEVTVGRFRAFVEAGGGTRPNPPSAGAGAHARIPGSGWDPNWNIDLVVDGTALSAALACDSQRQTWTAATGGNEDLPISCADWLEAMSFCIWDGGYLPTETEWHFAASGGAEQRAYPWSAPAGALSVDCSSANYSPDYVNGLFCTNTGSPNAVGAESPTGDGRWGHSDLGGNLDEWTLDSFAPYVDPCVDCANLDAFTVNNSRVVRGGDWANATGPLRSAHRAYTTPTGNRDAKIGFRCARPAI